MWLEVAHICEQSKQYKNFTLMFKSLDHFDSRFFKINTQCFDNLRIWGLRIKPFFFLQPSQEICKGKVTQLYSAGFCYEQLVKNGMDSTCGDLETLAHAAWIFPFSSSCGNGKAKTLPQSLKKSPCKSSIKDKFWMVSPDTCKQVGCRKGTLGLNPAIFTPGGNKINI